jgi:hypothetical protein
VLRQTILSIYSVKPHSWDVITKHTHTHALCYSPYYFLLRRYIVSNCDQKLVTKCFFHFFVWSCNCSVWGWGISADITLNYSIRSVSIIVVSFRRTGGYPSGSCSIVARDTFYTGNSGSTGGCGSAAIDCVVRLLTEPVQLGGRRILGTSNKQPARRIDFWQVKLVRSKWTPLQRAGHVGLMTYVKWTLVLSQNVRVRKCVCFHSAVSYVTSIDFSKASSPHSAI